MFRCFNNTPWSQQIQKHNWLPQKIWSIIAHLNPSSGIELSLLSCLLPQSESLPSNPTLSPTMLSVPTPNCCAKIGSDVQGFSPEDCVVGCLRLVDW